MAGGFIDFEHKPRDKNNKEHRAMEPAAYSTLTQYLEAMMKSARSTENSGFRKDYVLNIMAARMYFKVVEHNKDALDAIRLKSSKEPTPQKIATDIQKMHMSLIENEAAQEYLSNRSDAQLKALVAPDGHGGKLERDFRKHVRTHVGPILTDTPRRYMPTALARIDELKTQLKGLDRNAPEYATRAKEICMEILATRAAVNCVPGDKSTLKIKPNPVVSKRYYDSLMEKVGKNLGEDDLNRLVRGALKTPGHGGTMEKVVQELVREDMQIRKSPLTQDIPTRYQVSYGDRMTMLHENIAEHLGKLKRCCELTDDERRDLKDNLAELYQLGRSVEMQRNDRRVRPEEVRIDDVTAISLGKEQFVKSGAFDTLMDDLVHSDNALDVLDRALSAKNGAAHEQVDRFLGEEVQKALAQDRQKQQLDEDLKKKMAISDDQVKDKTGSQLAGQMDRELTQRAKDIWNNTLLSDDDRMRQLRVVCDKRMAMKLAFYKSQDAKKQLDQKEFAKQLNGVRFEQSLREIRRDPAYQRAIQDIVQEVEDRGVYRVTDPINKLYQTASGEISLQDRYVTAMEELKADKTVPEQPAVQQNAQVREQNEHVAPQNNVIAANH